MQCLTNSFFNIIFTAGIEAINDAVKFILFGSQSGKYIYTGQQALVLIQPFMDVLAVAKAKKIVP